MLLPLFLAMNGKPCVPGYGTLVKKMEAMLVCLKQFYPHFHGVFHQFKTPPF